MKERIRSAAFKLAIQHYFGQIRKDWRVSVPALILPGIGTVFTTYIPPLLVAYVVSRLADGEILTFSLILPYLLLFGGAWFIGEIIWRIAIYLLNKTDARGMYSLYTYAMSELLQKDIGFFHNNFAGSLTKKAISYGKSYETFVDTLSFNVIAKLIPLAFVAFILWAFSPWLVLALVGLMSFTVIIVIPLIKRRQKLVHFREQSSNTMAGHIADVIGNMDAVQAYAHEKEELLRHESNVADYMRKARKSWDYQNFRIDMVMSPLYVLTNVTGLAIALLIGGEGTTVAAVFVTFSYFASFTFVLWEFNRIYRNLESSLTEAAQFTDLLLDAPDLHKVTNPHAVSITKGAVGFNEVIFAYSDDASQALFEKLELHIAGGEKIALVGHSGGGKTTVTKLLLRFMDISSGEITIDGQNIAKTSLEDLRLAIAYVPQEPVMFHRSLADNIRYGNLNATDEQVIAAAKKAHAHEFIEKLPQKYDTPVGERGVKLSGGQRQRIAIARAILKDAPILVLDEATSALDSESEKLIQEALWELMKGRTAIVIAHRLSTIQKMDRIIVLDNGRIAEQGSHSELITQGGTYAQLWAHQSGGFIDE